MEKFEEGYDPGLKICCLLMTGFLGPVILHLKRSLPGDIIRLNLSGQLREKLEANLISSFQKRKETREECLDEYGLPERLLSKIIDLHGVGSKICLRKVMKGKCCYWIMRA